MRGVVKINVGFFDLNALCAMINLLSEPLVKWFVSAVELMAKMCNIFLFLRLNRDVKSLKAI